MPIKVKKYKTATAKMPLKNNIQKPQKKKHLEKTSASAEGTLGQFDKKDPLYMLPSNDELRQLEETNNLYKSNLFRLQVFIYNFMKSFLFAFINLTSLPPSVEFYDNRFFYNLLLLKLDYYIRYLITINI
jgi:hypothetical protein